MALMAIGAPSLALSRRNCAPRYVLLNRRVLAAIRKAILARLFGGSRPFPMILFPLLRLRGHTRSQETRSASSAHMLMPHPASAEVGRAVITSLPFIAAR